MNTASLDHPDAAEMSAAPAYSAQAFALLVQLGRAAFAVLTGKTHPDHGGGDPLAHYTARLDAVRNDDEARAFLRRRVPEIEPSVRDVGRGLAGFVPLHEQLRRDHVFRAFTRERALTFIDHHRDEADGIGLDALAMPLGISGADYIVHYHRKDSGETVGHL
ncbi:hypothetical protein [Kozakia baliensis]|uniref:hypothetical protein n=1 Tax=Kozakia baliensis TaxID=153496 RepID=UPI00068D6D02|nr:hypothetical protein [Kozakia baliensis]